MAVVRAFMAHHQGMTIVSIANALLGGCIREFFHAEPAIQATELLLQERMPGRVAVAHLRVDENRDDRPDARRRASGGAAFVLAERRRRLRPICSATAATR